MANHHLEYYLIASIQIDKAIDSYLEGTLGGYICATTLAGAGEEILGKLLSYQLNEDAALNEIVISILEQHDIDKNHKDFSKLKKEFRDMLNEPRNAYKHFNEEFCEKNVDPQFFAEMLINRAIINYEKLQDSITKKMGVFLEVTKAQRGVKEN